jgi:hypothetical protein
MKKLGFAEILTLLLVVFGGLGVLLHPDMWEKISSAFAGCIILIAIFIGYGDNE